MPLFLLFLPAARLPVEEGAVGCGFIGESIELIAIIAIAREFLLPAALDGGSGGGEGGGAGGRC